MQCFKCYISQNQIMQLRNNLGRLNDVYAEQNIIIIYHKIIILFINKSIKNYTRKFLFNTYFYY